MGDHYHDFQTTHWGTVLHAAGRASDPADSRVSAQAMSLLCQSYWLPLYAYLRRQGHDVHQAEDLTQAFFASLLEKDFLRTVDPAQGRFRAFLLTALKRFAANQWKHDTAQKRGGGYARLALDFTAAEHHYHLSQSSTQTADQVFLRNWAHTLLDRVLQRLRREFDAAGRAEVLEALEPFITPGSDKERMAVAAERIGLSPGAMRVAVHRLRRQYRRILREEIAQTVADSADIEDEIRSLFEAFRQ